MNILKLSVLLFVVLFCLVSNQELQAKEYNILDFGAIGDGLTINTQFINKTIVDCNKNGGGTVIIPSGTFFSGTVVLLSNVNLRLEAGAKLVGSKDTSDYLLLKDALFNEGYNRYGLIYSADATNISILGEGEINGNGTFFMNGLDKPHMGHDFDRKYVRQGEEFMKPGTIFDDGPVSYPFRPGLMILLERCENIHITGVTLKDSPEWTVRIGDCDNVDVEGISILNNPLIPNNDGIHCTNSRNIRISNCNIVAGDDAIIVTGFSALPAPSDPAYKAPSIGNKTGYAENVTVTNCVLSSRSACIRIGYGHHPIRNLVFSNLVMYDSNRGIGIFARDNSSIENVLFSNIVINNRLHSGHWWGKGEPIHISAIRDSEKGVVGKIKNIWFTDIISQSETGIVIYGTKENQIENIHLNRVNLMIRSGKYTNSYGGNFDLRPVFSNEVAVFKHDIPGLFAQYVKGLSISDLELNWSGKLPDFFTNGIEINHFENITIDRFKGTAASDNSSLAPIKVSNGTGLQITNCLSKGKSLVVLKEKIIEN
ncbi:MAG TPA: glycosyl hydrolase family 28 protein [Prolixibacteraceae bacterium]|nr:glycosyl hydrolase family 28 protein [Prolixibacteraceae bacterium]